MKLLLDTNVFLWVIAGERKRLSARAAAAIADEANEIWLSAVSLWEVILKVTIGKLELPASPEFFREHMTALGVRRVVPVEPHHVFGTLDLPDHHRDPFDRLLISQCRAEGLSLVASDRALRRYPVEILW